MHSLKLYWPEEDSISVPKYSRVFTFVMIFSQTFSIVVTLLISTVSKMVFFHNNYHTTEIRFDLSRLRRETAYNYCKF